MWSDICTRSGYYARYYQQSVLDFWEQMTPPQYASLLIGVAIAGWIMMKAVRH